MHGPAVAEPHYNNDRMKEPVRKYDSRRHFPFDGLNWIRFFNFCRVNWENLIKKKNTS